MLLRILTFAIFAALAGSVSLTNSAYADAQVSVKVNFSDLDEYGEWVYIAGHGDVWRPYADSEWRPFTYGHWAWSDDGWLWVSDEPFGWVVCHYGNWDYDDDWGWVWIPGYEWSPARVEWYVTNDEIGWAPLFPPAHSGRPRVVSRAHWSFVPTRFFVDAEIHGHVSVRAVPSDQSVSVVVRREAPRIEVVRRVIGRPVVVVQARKVTVTGRPRTIMRVEVESQARPQTTVVVPIGPRYREATVRRVPPRPAVRTEVETPVEAKGEVEARPAQPTTRITIQRESPHTETRVEVQQQPTVRKVEVKKAPATNVQKVRVKSVGKNDEDEEDENGNGNKKRVIIKRK